MPRSGCVSPARIVISSRFAKKKEASQLQIVLEGAKVVVIRARLSLSGDEVVDRQIQAAQIDAPPESKHVHAYKSRVFHSVVQETRRVIGGWQREDPINTRHVINHPSGSPTHTRIHPDTFVSLESNVKCNNTAS